MSCKSCIFLLTFPTKHDTVQPRPVLPFSIVLWFSCLHWQLRKIFIDGSLDDWSCNSLATLDTSCVWTSAPPTSYTTELAFDLLEHAFLQRLARQRSLASALARKCHTGSTQSERLKTHHEIISRKHTKPINLTLLNESSVFIWMLCGSSAGLRHCFDLIHSHQTICR